MKIYVDSANMNEIKAAAELGLCDGVTTNPTLLAKEGKGMEKVIREIAAFVKGPVHAETLSLKKDDILAEGRRYHGWAKNIVVKIPFCTEGLQAANVFQKEGIPTNITLIFSAAQALLAAKAGATYVCPFVGRLDDIGAEGMGVISEIMEIFGNQPEICTEVIVASIRHTQHVLDSAKLGAHIATVPSKVLQQMAMHPLTESGIAKFNEDAKKFEKLA